MSRSLERDVALRYQSAAELLADLELWAGTGKSGIIAARLKPGPRRWADENKRLLAGAMGLVLLLIGEPRDVLPHPPQERGCSRGKEAGGASRQGEIAGDPTLP